MQQLRALLNPIARVARTYRDEYLRRYNIEKLPEIIYSETFEKRKVSFCTTCMNRFFHLSKTYLRNIDDNLKYPSIEFVLINYNSQDGLHAWAKKSLSRYIERGVVNYYHTLEPKFFHASVAKNLAHKVATGDIVCNLDADNFTGKDFALYINYKMHLLGDNALLHFKKAPLWGTEGRIVLSKDRFMSLGGYDESFEPIGHEDHDLINRAKAMGMKYENIQIENFLHYLSNTTYDKAANCSNEKINYYDYQNRNKVRSNENIANGRLKANPDGWGLVPLTKNFSEETVVFS